MLVTVENTSFSLGVHTPLTQINYRKSSQEIHVDQNCIMRLSARAVSVSERTIVRDNCGNIFSLNDKHTCC